MKGYEPILRGLAATLRLGRPSPHLGGGEAPGRLVLPTPLAEREELSLEPVLWVFRTAKRERAGVEETLWLRAPEGVVPVYRQLRDPKTGEVLFAHPLPAPPPAC